MYVASIDTVFSAQCCIHYDVMAVDGGDSKEVKAQLVGVTKIYSSDQAFAAVTQKGAVIAWGDANCNPPL